MSRPLLVAALLLASCAAFRSPQAELVVAEEEIGGGDPVRGVRRMERAMDLLHVADPARWNLLGETAATADPDLAQRAFARAEALRWPDASPRNEVRLTPPFAGRWLVTQGNRGPYSHGRLPDRFAWDFQMVDARGEASREGSQRMTAFFGFGAPVLATADGVVEIAEDGRPDNLRGVRNLAEPGGNLVVLRHAAGELSRYCHLQCGSVTVKPGQSVRRGDVIGRCGVSGNAAEPHLHYVLRVGPTSQDTSIPARFDGLRILRDGAEVEGGVPETGDVVIAGE